MRTTYRRLLRGRIHPCGRVFSGLARTSCCAQAGLQACAAQCRAICVIRQFTTTHDVGNPLKCRPKGFPLVGTLLAASFSAMNYTFPKDASNMGTRSVPRTPLCCNIILTQENIQEHCSGRFLPKGPYHLHSVAWIDLKFSRIHGWPKFFMEMASIALLLCVASAHTPFQRLHS